MASTATAAATTKSSSQETATKIKTLLKTSLQEERADAARLDELRREFATLIALGDLWFSSTTSTKLKVKRTGVQQKWNAWLHKQHSSFIHQLVECMREGNRRTAVRTMWGLIAASPFVTPQGNHHVHLPFLFQWLEALVAMPLDVTQDRSMQHLLEAELGQRDVQYYALRCVTRWANETYQRQKANEVEDEESSVPTQEQAGRMLNILMMIPFASSQNALDSSNSKYLFPPSEASGSRSKNGGAYEDQEDGQEDSSEDDDSDDDNSSDDDEESSDDEEDAPRKKRRTMKEKKKKVEKRFAYQDIKFQLGELSKAWMAILRLPLSTSSLKKALPFLSQHVLPKIRTPLRFADLFMHAYGGADGEEKEKVAHRNPVISLLALDGLFYLMTQHRLEYPLFYGQLYALLKPSLFYIRHRARFFALLEKCLLRNEMLPAHLVAAFLKRLLQCALQAPPPGALFVLALSSNLLRKHEECAALIHRTSNNDDEDGMDDVYNPDTDDPVECRALESSLWELQALERHYHPAVATLAKSIGREDPKSAMLQLDEMAQHSYASLIEQERKRHAKKANRGGGHKRKHGGYDKEAKPVTPVTFVKPSALFPSTDIFAGILKVPTSTVVAS